MVNRWEDRLEPKPGQGKLYWHILFKDDAGLQSLAVIARKRLMSFPSLHLTPMRWLHLTVMVAGLVEDFTELQIKEMVILTRQLLSAVPPVTVSLARVLYHPEAILLAVRPTGALDPIYQAV